MSNRATRTAYRRVGITVPEEAELRAAFITRNPTAPVRSINRMARLVAVFAEVMSELDLAGRQSMPATKAGLRKAILKMIWSPEQETKSPRRKLAAAGGVETKVGQGMGKLLSVREGRERLAHYTEARPLENWAGPTAGPGEIERELGVPRSTLNEWHRRGNVIGLLRGERKHVYPLDQFVDARPTPGVMDVAKVAPDERSAWLWLRQPHVRFGTRTPLEALKAGQREAVREAAERDFV